MDRAPCEGVTKAGARCRSFPLPGSPYCFMHGDPAAAAAARSRGSVQAGRLRSLEGKRRKLDSPRALAAFVSTLIHDALEGKVEADLARTIGYLAAVQTKVIEQARQSDVETMLAEVRALTEQARRRA
jgi:hypothetical protein